MLTVSPELVQRIFDLGRRYQDLAIAHYEGQTYDVDSYEMEMAAMEDELRALKLQATETVAQ